MGSSPIGCSIFVAVAKTYKHRPSQDPALRHRAVVQGRDIVQDLPRERRAGLRDQGRADPLASPVLAEPLISGVAPGLDRRVRETS